MQGIRRKLKLEKKQQETQEINEQFKAGNLNYGIKFEAPEALSWEEFKKQNPTCDFWDYLDYKRSLKTPEIEKLELQEQKFRDYKHEKMMNAITKIEGNNPNKVQLGFNFFHPEQEKSDCDLILEREQRMKDKIANILKQQKQ